MAGADQLQLVHLGRCAVVLDQASEAGDQVRDLPASPAAEGEEGAQRREV